MSVVEELAVPIAADLGLRIWDVRYLKEGSQWFLRVFIDKDGGVDINDCENMSRALDAPLDELDPIAGEYILEVSSPGIERELIRPEHFMQFIGADGDHHRPQRREHRDDQQKGRGLYQARRL